MLELRPTCEHCNKALPPGATEARICSFECTFCTTCVENVLSNVCPNCGGGFAPRPIRPASKWVGHLSTETRPPSAKVTHQPVDAATQAKLVATVGNRMPEAR